MTPDCGLVGVVTGGEAGFGAAGAEGGTSRLEGGVAVPTDVVDFSACCLSNSRGSEVIKACSSGEATTFRAT